MHWLATLANLDWVCSLWCTFFVSIASESLDVKDQLLVIVNNNHLGKAVIFIHLLLLVDFF